VKYIIGPTFCTDSPANNSASLAQEIEIIAGALEVPDDRRLTLTFWSEAPDELRGHVHARGWWAAEPFVFRGTQRALALLVRRSATEHGVFSDARFVLGDRKGAA